MSWLIAIMVWACGLGGAPEQVSAEPAADARASSARLVVARMGPANDAGRRKVVTDELRRLGVHFRLEAFTREGRKGWNVATEAIGNGPRLLLGAHFDRADAGQGAVDNASGVTAVLLLLAELKKKPLEHHSVAAVFFDLHEKGMWGAEAYIEAHRSELPAEFVNVDTFGYGDTLWVMTADAGPESLELIKQAAAQAGLGMQLGSDYPLADHAVFRKAGVASASFSLAPQQEIDELIALMKRGKFERSESKLLAVLHTEADRPEKVDAAAVVRGADAIETVLRGLDRQ